MPVEGGTVEQMRWSRLYRWYAGIGDDPRLAVAQVANLRHQIPLLYGLLLINSLAVAITHHGVAPRVLTEVVPGLLFAVTAVRMIGWFVAARTPREVTPESARGQLRRVTIFAAAISSGYITWALMLMRYGGSFQQAHAAVYLSTTVIGCTFCLMALPQAAMIVSLMVLPPFIASCFMRADSLYGVIAINVALVLAVLLRVLLNSFAYFRNRVMAQVELEEQHAELVRLNAENVRLAMTDSLTGLANRRQFRQDLDRLALHDAGSTFAVGLLDLDRFKPVNDTYGHHIGDILLIELAQRMRTIAAPLATLYRLGGDEFGLLLPGTAAEVTAVGERLCQGLDMPFQIGELRISVGGSLGIAVSPDAGRTGDELFDRADYALYQAKRVNGGGMCVFTPELEIAIRSDRAIEAALQTSVFDDELRIVGQPIVCTATGAISAVEILARWYSPTLGEIGPADFIPIAERSTLIHGITLSIFRKGLAAAHALPPDTMMSFNISASDLLSPATMTGIEREVTASGVDPARICIEVTETAVMRNADAAARALGRLRESGMQVALDDFGTGFSSLSNLHQLPLDKVKIDRSFMLDVEATRGWSVVQAIVSLCRSLDLDCVAEGVETEAQRDALIRVGCEHAQGYLFAGPMPIEPLGEVVRRGVPLRAA